MFYTVTTVLSRPPPYLCLNLNNQSKYKIVIIMVLRCCSDTEHLLLEYLGLVRHSNEKNSNNDFLSYKSRGEGKFEFFSVHLSFYKLFPYDN